MINSETAKTIDKDAANFFLKNMVLYGANNSGKTTVMMDIIYRLRQLIPNVMAFAGSPGAMESLRGVVPNRMLSDRLTLGALQAIWDRQLQAGNTYRIANDTIVLQSLFRRVASEAQKHMERTIDEPEAQSLKKIEESEMKAESKRDQAQKIAKMAAGYRATLYKGLIRKRKVVLTKMGVTAAEEQALRFLDFNPNLLLIIDDCAAMITKKMQKTETFKNFFFNYRHAGITVLFTFQDDTSLEADLRKQQSLTFLNTQQCASAYFERQSNFFQREMKMEAERMVRAIFDKSNTNFPKHTKLLYIRDDEYPLRHYLADVHPKFKFGSAQLWAFCDRIEQQRNACRSINSSFGVYR